MGYKKKSLENNTSDMGAASVQFNDSDSTTDPDAPAQGEYVGPSLGSGGAQIAKEKIIEHKKKRKEFLDSI